MKINQTLHRSNAAKMRLCLLIWAGRAQGRLVLHGSAVVQRLGLAETVLGGISLIEGCSSWDQTEMTRSGLYAVIWSLERCTDRSKLFSVLLGNQKTIRQLAGTRASVRAVKESDNFAEYFTLECLQSECGIFRTIVNPWGCCCCGREAAGIAEEGEVSGRCWPWPNG